MIDHVNLPVVDFEKACAFYEAVLAAWGIQSFANDGTAIGFGMTHWSFGLLKTHAPINPLHLAFSAKSEKRVDAFYAAALKAGATCNGKPGLRPDYGDRYYACFVIDPDGHNIEAVFRG